MGGLIKVQHGHHRRPTVQFTLKSIGLLWLIISLAWLSTTIYLYSSVTSYHHHMSEQRESERKIFVQGDTITAEALPQHNVGGGVDKNEHESTGTAVDSDSNLDMGNFFPVKKSEACVRKTNGQCEQYPCTGEDGVPIQTTLGYAGRFVTRDANVKKQAMRRGGGDWASGCVISHKHKFAYIHILKSGGSATKEFLRRSLCGDDDPECKRADPSVLRPIACTQIAKQHPDYFTFSFVRSPFSRMYSMYSMMDGFPRDREAGGHVTDTVPFAKFVMTDPGKRSAFTFMSPTHYWAQTDFTFSKDSCPSFDFLGRVEQFDQDMRIILEHLNAKEMIDYLDSIGGRVVQVNSWGSNKKKSISGGLQAEYSSSEVRDRVVDTYKRDFDLLGYDWHAVPST